ncbi:oligosaccharide flippase family protein [Mycolicibacterium elephantis]
MSKGTRGDVLRQAFTVLFGRGIIRFAQLIAFLIFARLMSPADFGWFGIITTAIALAATLGSLGLRQAFAYEIGQNRLTVGEAFGTALLVWPVLTLVSAAIVFGLYGRQLPNCSPAQAGGIITVGIAATILLLFLQGVFLGQGNINAFALSEALPRVALVVFAIALSFSLSIGLPAALWANVSSVAVAAPIAVWLALRKTKRLGLRFDRLRKGIPYGLLFALNVLLVTLCSRVSMFVIERMRGPTPAGEFFAAVRVYEIFLEIATAFGLVLFSNATRQTEGISTLSRNVRIGCWMFWLFNCFALLVWIAAPLVITTTIGAEYASAGPALQILALSMAPAAAAKVIYPTLAGSGRPGFGTPIIGVSLAVNIALAMFLVSRIGVNGGAIALVVGQYVLFAGYILRCRREFKTPVRDFLLPHRGDVKNVSRALSSKLKKVRR